MSGVKACLELLRPRRREAVPPGVLYRLMSTELRARQRCAYGCSMPLPSVKEPASPDEPNWDIEGLWPQCPSCLPLARAIATEFRLRYDVKHYPGPVSRRETLKAVGTKQAA